MHVSVSHFDGSVFSITLGRAWAVNVVVTIRDTGVCILSGQ